MHTVNPSWRLINTDISQVPYTVDSNGGPRATAFRFLDLPVELRDMVYKGLLCPHIDGSQYRRYESIQDYGLEPAILRTCKQICVEGSQVLYEKNSTVLIRLDAQAWRAFEKRSWDPTFQEIFPSARVEGGKVGGTPVLAIDMSVLPQYHIKGKREPKEQAVFIGFLPGLPKFCRFLTASCWCNMTLQLVINMEGLGARGPKVRQQMLSDCLDYFCEVRGLGGAVILTEPQHRATAAKVAHVMKKDEESINKAFGPIRAYEARVLRQLQEKRWNDARDTLQNALEFMGLLRRRLCIERYWNGTDKKLTHKLVVKMMETQWKYISICLKVGRTGDVHHQIRQMFRYSYDADKLTPAEQKAYSDRLADAHHAIGQAYLIDGFLNSAVYSFLQVLFTALGHREADEAIDLLEKRLKSSSKPEDVMVKLNIETVLEEVRHQGPNQHRLSKGQRKDTVEGFRATYQETEGLRRSRKLHVSTLTSQHTTNIHSDYW